MRTFFADRLVTRWLGHRLPRRTIRLRLTVLYGGLFLASGAALLAITYVLVARQYSSNFFVSNGKAVFVGTSVPAESAGQTTIGGVSVKIPAPEVAVAPTPQQLLAQAHAQSAAALRQLMIQSGIALAIMALISIWLGWLVAGRALRPLRTITNAARDISASNLHRRLALAGPDDELKQLGTTFDGLLARLESSFEAQRQFVANASHELRTPLTLERTLIEVALADPNATEATLRETARKVLRAGEQQERLIEALLTLSRSQRGLDRHEHVDLAAIAADVLPTVNHDGLTITTTLQPAGTSGDPRLLERLVANLVGNAVHHNVPNGRVDVATSTTAGRAVLTVANTGPAIPPGEVARLFEPFRRLDPDRTANTNGVGLGLSIVDAIATAHRASLTALAQPEGGLAVEVSFLAAPGNGS
jgi:signal transduction histidine kinase